jgi:hypothetical protein
MDNRMVEEMVVLLALNLAEMRVFCLVELLVDQLDKPSDAAMVVLKEFL